MPRNVIGSSPFPVLTIESDDPLTLVQITSRLQNVPGVSLCVRTTYGSRNRGGYFFHIKQVGSNYDVFDFEKNKVATLDSEKLVRFINHVSGRLFDSEMLVFCQSVVNFRVDQSMADQGT